MAGTFADSSISSNGPTAFLEYEQEAKRKIPLLNQHINALDAGAVRGFNRIVAEAEMDFSEADGFVKAMRGEFNRLAASDRNRFKGTLDRYQSDVEQLRRAFLNAKARQEKAYLLAGASKGAKGQTERLLTTTEHLQNARRVVGETEQIGDQIMSDMEGQRRQLVTAADQVQETNLITKQARRVLNYMTVRAHQHKACLILIIIVLLILIGVVFYYGIIQRHLRHRS